LVPELWGGGESGVAAAYLKRILIKTQRKSFGWDRKLPLLSGRTLKVKSQNCQALCPPLVQVL